MSSAVSTVPMVLRWKVALSAVLTALLVMVGVTFTGPNAWAASAQVEISQQAFDKSIASSADEVKFSFAWSVPNGSQPGDSFTIELPQELRAVSTAAFSLKGPGGDTVATAEWAGKTVTFTLTEFVKGKNRINGSAYFPVSWDRSVVDTTQAANYSLLFRGTGSWTLPLALDPDGPSGEGQSTSKVGWWMDDAQGATSTVNQLGWVVYLDTGSGRVVPAPVTITDTPGPGSKINIESVVGYVNNERLDPKRYTVEAHGARGVQIQLFGNYGGESAIYAGENIYFQYSADLLPGEKGVFTNSAVVKGLHAEPKEVSSEVRRAGAGGDGNGDYTPTAPVLPAVTEGVCEADGSVSAPSLELAKTEGVSYEVSGEPVAGGTVVVTATAGDGVVLAAADGWTLAGDGMSATAEVSFADVPCAQPEGPELRLVTPGVGQGVCEVGASGLTPALNLAEAPGLAYEVEGDMVPGSTVAVTAVAESGFQLAPVDGWSLDAEQRTAKTELRLDEQPCAEAGVPGAGAQTPAVAEHGLAATGLGAPALIAAAAVLMAAAGALLVGRRRIA